MKSENNCSNEHLKINFSPNRGLTIVFEFRCALFFSTTINKFLLHSLISSFHLCAPPPPSIPAIFHLSFSLPSFGPLYTFQYTERAPLGQDVINDGRLSPPPAATTFPKAISADSQQVRKRQRKNGLCVYAQCCIL